MFREFFLQGPRARRAFAAVGVVCFLGHQIFKAWLKYALNNWYQVFYDTLQENVDFGSGDTAKREALRSEVSRELGDFFLIVAPAVAVHPLAGWIRNWWVFVWRRTLCEAYLFRWDTNLPPIEGASQRVHEDTQRFAAGIQSCVSVLLESIFTLVVFCPVLFGLDPVLMAVAIVAAVGGIGVSSLVGRKLVDLEVNNQVAEAAFRRQLVLLEVEPPSVVTNGTPLSGFLLVLRSLSTNYSRLYLNFVFLGTWLAAFEQGMVILPYALVAPRLFDDQPDRQLTLGQLVQITNAFGKVFDSFNVISDSWLAINEFRSVLRRLREFEHELYTTSPPVARLMPETELSDAAPP